LCKFITAFSPAMRLDGGMTARDEHLVSLPACNESGFGALISEQNQDGADL
jgi:hypothetical protein